MSKLKNSGKLIDHRGRLILDDNPKHAVGEMKVDITALPSAGIIHGARAAQYGNVKYGYYNHRDSKVSFRQYLGGIGRHYLAVLDGEDLASDSLEEHLGHLIAGASIILDAKERGNLVDDRPPRGAAPRLVTQKIGKTSASSKFVTTVTVKIDPTVKKIAEQVDREIVALHEQMNRDIAKSSKKRRKK